MQYDGLIPLIYEICHPIAFILFYNNSTNNSSYFLVSFDEIITSSISFSPKIVYLKCEGNGFKSKLSGLTIEGGVGSITLGNA